jgi:signal transduction histidine kinase
MSNQASERLRTLSDRIMQTWEARAIEEVSAASHHHSLALRDSLPDFLSQLVQALSTTVDRTAHRVRWDRKENERIGKKHGKERAKMAQYTMDQLIFEYHIFREVICDIMEEVVPLTPIEREVIVCAVEQAVNDAATEFSQTLNDIQETFTNALAHDLRGPITATKLSAQLLILNPSDIQANIKIATRIVNGMDRVDLMIHDLLDAGRLRAGQRLELTFSDCDLEAVLRQICAEANSTNDHRIAFQGLGPVKGQWNESGIRRVIDNLITNALKFSLPVSKITVKLKTTDQGVEMSVHNFGKPIPEEEISSLFKEYRRARASHGKVGWGLGLTVIQGITEAHGGSVSVTSSEKEGTTFTVYLPGGGD